MCGPISGIRVQTDPLNPAGDDWAARQGRLAREEEDRQRAQQERLAAEEQARREAAERQNAMEEAQRAQAASEAARQATATAGTPYLLPAVQSALTVQRAPDQEPSREGMAEVFERAKTARLQAASAPREEAPAPPPAAQPVAQPLAAAGAPRAAAGLPGVVSSLTTPDVPAGRRSVSRAPRTASSAPALDSSSLRVVR